MSTQICGPILITGASGFVGKHFVEELAIRHVPTISISSADCDLTDLDATVDCFALHGDATAILHLASYQAAGDFPARHPGDQLQINSRIHLNVLDAWRRELPEARFVAAGTSCAYPVQDGGLREESYLEGAIHGSVYSYAMSKRMGISATHSPAGSKTPTIRFFTFTNMSMACLRQLAFRVPVSISSCRIS